MTIPGIEHRGELGADEPAARALTPAGDLLLLVSGASAAARAAAHAQDDELVCVMEITDVAPVSVVRRVRAHASIAGWLTPVPPSQRAKSALLLSEHHPVGELLEIDGGDARRPAWTLLRVEVGEAYVDDLWGAQEVDPDELAAAEPDPLAPYEAELLQHLHAAHADQVRDLCTLLGDRACAAAGATAVPVALDRFGLRVRYATADGRCFDARFDFSEPVADIVGLRRAMHTLFEAATR